MFRDVRFSGVRFSWVTLLVPLLALTIARGQIHAQMYTTFRSVEGTVTQDGEPLAGATVQIENTRTLDIRSYITKKNGAYRFPRLFDDVDYQLRADYRGRSSHRQTLSKFNSKRTAVMDLKIRPPSQPFAAKP